MTETRISSRTQLAVPVLAIGLGVGLLGWAVFLAATKFINPENIASVANIYVDKDGLGGACSEGRDRTAAQNITTPVCSIERGLAIAAAGDTVLVRGATFNRTTALGLYATDGVTLKAYPGEAVAIDFTNSPGTIGVDFKSNNFTLEGFEIRNAGQECIWAVWDGTVPHDVTIKKNHIHHCGFTFVNKYQGGLQINGTNITLEENYIHDTASHNVYLIGNNLTVKNNIIHTTNHPLDRGSYGIQVGTDSAGVTGANIVHNVIGESGNRSAITLYSPNSSLNNIVIANNVLYQNPYSPVYVYALSSTTFSGIQIKNNIFAQNGSGNCVYFTLADGSSGGCTSPPGTFTVSGNIPLASTSLIGFRNLAGRDYYPVVGSPMIDSALANLQPSVTNDYVGTLRPQGNGPDIGAYEYTGASCIENWSCGSWSTCTNGTQTRTCTDLNACGTTVNRPPLSQSCGTADTMAPTVTLTSPANRATVSGTSVTVSASASDNVGVVGVQFKLNGVNLQAEDTTAPYAITWNTTTLNNATYTLTAVARDAAGNQGESNFFVTVSNPLVPCTPEPLPLDLRQGSGTVGLVKCTSITLSLASAGAATMTLVAFDIDAPAEAIMWINGHQVALPPDAYSNDVNAYPQPFNIPLEYLLNGSNEIRFKFADNLSGTTGGFQILSGTTITINQLSGGGGKVPKKNL